MKTIQRALYVMERTYPYVVALVSVILCKNFKFNMMISKEYTELLNGLVTLDSIIIGFLGAVMPVILSMKNESKFVKYVFEKDKKNLFCKYLKVTILLGILNVVSCLVMHVKDAIPDNYWIKFYYVWIFITVVFLTSTYRSMSHMITLIFTKDEKEVIGSEDGSDQVNEARAMEIRQKYKGN